jgi:hypothetical protein
MSEVPDTRVPAGDDPEIRAIVALRAALEPLGPHEVARVLEWADKRYGDGGLVAHARSLMAGLAEALEVTAKAATGTGISPAALEILANRVLAEAVKQHGEDARP